MHSRSGVALDGRSEHVQQRPGQTRVAQHAVARALDPAHVEWHDRGRPALLDDVVPRAHDRPPSRSGHPPMAASQRNGDRPTAARHPTTAVNFEERGDDAHRGVSRSPRPAPAARWPPRRLTARGARTRAAPGQGRPGAVRAAGLPRHQRRRHLQAGARRPRHLLHLLQLQGGDLRRGRRRPAGRPPARRRGRAAPPAGQPAVRAHRAGQPRLPAGIRAERPDDGRPRAGRDVQPTPGRDPPGQPPLLRPAQHDVDPALAGAGPRRRAHRRRRTRRARSAR